MKLGIAQMVIAVTIIALAMLTQPVPSLDSGRGNRRPDSNEPMLGAYSRALAQDDNEDGDNDDEDDDNDEGDNSDPVDDGASLTFDASVREATGTTTGGDDRFGLPADRVLVQAFPWMPPGVSLTIRLTDPAVATTSCRLVGDLVFQIEGRDDTGTALTQLPAEVNLSARYTDQQASGLSRQAATLLWLDPADGQWKPAPKLVTSPSTNYVAASVTALGSYAVCTT